jgi:N-acetylneuraminic acid mutarotase
MISKEARPLALAFGVLVTAGCSDTPTQPGTPMGQETAPDFAVAVNNWITRADLPSTERNSLAAAVVTNASGQSILYAIGGTTLTGGSLSKVQAYNAATNIWTYRASLPVPLYWSNGAGVIKGKIYISGGLTNSKRFSSALYAYDPATNLWSRKRDMPTTTFRGVTGVINDKLYVVTDCDQENCDSFLPVAFYRYDPATDQWTTLTAPPGGHAWAMGGVIGGKFYVTGGENSQPQLVVYDPATGQWTRKTPLARLRWLGAGVALAGKLYVIGGLADDAEGNTRVVRTVSVYDPASDAWTTRAPLPTERFGFAAGRVLLNGQPRIEVVGGPRPGNNLQYVP